MKIIQFDKESVNQLEKVFENYPGYKFIKKAEIPDAEYANELFLIWLLLYFNFVGSFFSRNYNYSACIFITIK